MQTSVHKMNSLLKEKSIIISSLHQLRLSIELQMTVISHLIHLATLELHSARVPTQVKAIACRQETDPARVDVDAWPAGKKATCALPWKRQGQTPIAGIRATLNNSKVYAECQSEKKSDLYHHDGFLGSNAGFHG